MNESDKKKKNKLNLNKEQLLSKFDLFQYRLEQNPAVSYKFKRYYRLQLDLMRSRFVRIEDLEYAWPLFCELWDDLRAYNDRMGQSELKKLNPLFEKRLNEKLLQVPPEPKKTSSGGLKIDFLKNVPLGGLK